MINFPIEQISVMPISQNKSIELFDKMYNKFKFEKVLNEITKPKNKEKIENVFEKELALDFEEIDYLIDKYNHEYNFTETLKNIQKENNENDLIEKQNQLKIKDFEPIKDLVLENTTTKIKLIKNFQYPKNKSLNDFFEPIEEIKMPINICNEQIKEYNSKKYKHDFEKIYLGNEIESNTPFYIILLHKMKNKITFDLNEETISFIKIHQKNQNIKLKLKHRGYLIPYSCCNYGFINVLYQIKTNIINKN